MICVIALIVFGILGIFSATHRRLAIEAFDCVFRKITLRKCESKLDVRLKSQITGRLLGKSPMLGKFIYKHFELLSWAFLILTIWSLVSVIIGGYNFYLYGNCNGPQESGFCIFDPLGENQKFSSFQDPATCSAAPPNPNDLILGNINLNMFPSFLRETNNDVLFIGCYSCPYTREAWPAIKKLYERKDVNFVFAHLPAKKDTQFISNVLSCVYTLDKAKFIAYNDALFKTDVSLLGNETKVIQIAAGLGLNADELNTCAYSNETFEKVNAQLAELEKIGIYGTPTVFINGQAQVGPKPYRVYSRLIK